MKRSSRLHFLVIALMALLFSCKSFNYRIANEYYEQFAYSKAIPKYEKVLEKEMIPIAAARLAESYRKIGNSSKAEKWYSKVVEQNDVAQEYKLAMAEVYMENGKYQEAATWFKDYIELNATDTRAKKLLFACDSIHLFFEDTTAYTVEVPTFNKVNESNFSPAFYKSGIVFLSDRPVPGKNRNKSMWTGREYLDLYFTSPVEGSDKWLEPELLQGDINGVFDEGPAVFSKDFSRVYFTRTDYKGKNLAKNEQNETILKLYSGRLDGSEWNLESALPFNDEKYSVGHPALSADGNMLFFVSDMPWGYGGTDLYSTTFSDGKWSDPVNLGSRVNTDGNEMFPFYSSDSILYFASDGHIGLGGLDIYETIWNGDYWVSPDNLQYPVNSPKDDFGYIIDSLGILGYFSSNRVSKSDNIFSFIKHPPILVCNLFVKDASSKDPISKVSAVLINGDDRNIISTDKSGEVTVALPEKSNVEVVVQANGYFSNSIFKSTVGIKRSKVFIDTLFLEKIPLNKAMVCTNILFDKKSTKITPQIELALDSLYIVLENNPNIQIEIISHTDSRGSYSSNLRVSRKRSDEISIYLIKKGIIPHRLISKGYGERKLLNYCRNGILCLEEDHMINNRVEIKVVDIFK